ncbi:MAG TPA: DUF423 domain-containing protein [Chitinophagales bacterium]|nr:DUF423 domain-containing protein [Chitinophagales bacterium]
MKKYLIVAATISGAMAVGLGAFAAHGLKSFLSEENLRIFHTAVEYQFYHSLALMLTGILTERFNHWLVSFGGINFIAGIILFSGSLYLLATHDASTWLGYFTPFGGLLFLAGWISLAIGVLSARTPSEISK